MRLHDLSPTISADLAVFPGDTTPSREVLLDMQKGDHLTLSTLHATVHLGTHLDAPSHYGKDAETIDRVDLARCMGPCRVLAVTDRDADRVSIDDVTGLAGGEALPERVLLRTGSYPDPTRWIDTFRGLEPDLVDHLADRGVRLVGVDTPSVDPESARILLAHHRCLARDVLILEGLMLSGVPDGDHELIALPLKLAGFDASPVRAVLVER